ncbi:Phosphoglycerate mutase [Candidatus Magnetomorum sp. HK-1]|nr:Phosphoglycerate mutase [Candidatus Magnetomorum sp. HK-1]
MIYIALIPHLPTHENRKGLIVGTKNINAIEEIVSNITKSINGLIPFLDLIHNISPIPIEVYTSSIRRSLQTCEAFFGKTEYPIIVDERLRQIEYGPEYTMIYENIIESEYEYYVQNRFPGGESFMDFSERIRSFLVDHEHSYANSIIATPCWRFSPAIFEHICNGVKLEKAIRTNHNLKKKFIFSSTISK